jgi:hypothetical protein
VIGAAFMNRNVDDSSIGALADAALWWSLGSLLSWPWALMFHHRSRRFRQLGKAPGIPIAYIGMVLLVFVCCGLTVLGFAATVYAIGAAGTGNRFMPFYGFLASTAGIALCVLTERAARKLEVQTLVRGVFELLMIPGVILGIVSLVALLWQDSSPYARGRLVRRAGGPGGVGHHGLADATRPTRTERCGAGAVTKPLWKEHSSVLTHEVSRF